MQFSVPLVLVLMKEFWQEYLFLSLPLTLYTNIKGTGALSTLHFGNPKRFVQPTLVGNVSLFLCQSIEILLRLLLHLRREI